MLINTDEVKESGLSMFFKEEKDPVLLQEGIYEVFHFGGTSFLESYAHYPTGLSVGPYGVADNIQQILDNVPELQDPNRKFTVAVTRVVRKDQAKTGGWRWHKWGEYIGDFKPQHEYLYDEEGIEEVLVFHIYEKVQGKISRNARIELLELLGEIVDAAEEGKKEHEALIWKGIKRQIEENLKETL